MRNILKKSLFMVIGCLLATSMWGEKMYVITSQCNIPLTPGMNKASYQLFTWDGTTQEATTAISCDQQSQSGFYYNSSSLAYANVTNTSNYSTSSGSNRTMRGIKLASGATMTITLNSVTIKKIAVIGRCASSDPCTIDIAGEVVNTSSNTIFFFKEVESDDVFRQKIEIKNTSKKEYNLFVYLIEGVGGPSKDATLSDLKIDGVTIEGFAPTTYSYNYTVPAKATSVPVVTATKNDSKASDPVITQATMPTVSNPTQATVTVTAEDPTVTKTYTITFYRAELSHDATLKEIQVDGVAISEFNPTTTHYNVSVPYSQTTIPVVTATTNYIGAQTPVITQASSLTGTATIVVTAEDETTTQTYTVAFSKAPASNDATLKTLTYNGTSVPDFSASRLNYTVNLVNGSALPVVAATANHPYAQVVVTQPADLESQATALVTAEDGTTTKTYTIQFHESEGIPVPYTKLKLHIPGIYSGKGQDGGYEGNCHKDANNREFELYYANRDADGKVASITLLPGDRRGGGIENTKSATSTYVIAKDNWVEARMKSISGGTSAKAGKSGEFAEVFDEWRVGADSISMHIQGYDQFSFYGADKNVEIDSKTGTFKKKQRFQVFIDGIMEPETQCSTSPSVRRYDLSAGEHVVTVKGMADGESNFYAFSLREAQVPQTQWIGGNDSTQVVKQTDALTYKIRYRTKYNNVPGAETRLIWEGEPATGFELKPMGQTGGLYDTLYIGGEAKCPTGTYSFSVVSYYNGREVSRSKVGTFKVISSIIPLSNKSVLTYKDEAMDPIRYRYYALDPSAVQLTWFTTGSAAPAGIVTKAENGIFAISGTPTAIGTYAYAVTVTGADSTYKGTIEVKEVTYGNNPVLFLNKDAEEYKYDCAYNYLLSKGYNPIVRTAKTDGLRPSEQYAPYKWILISEDADADNPEVIELIRGGANLPVLNMKGFTYSKDEGRLGWGEPDNGAIDSAEVKDKGCNIVIERSSHPIFNKLPQKTDGMKLKILSGYKKNGVMPIKITNMPGEPVCLATAPTRGANYYEEGALQAAIHESPSDQRGGKYICFPISRSATLSDEGKLLMDGIIDYLLSPTQATIEAPELRIESFTVSGYDATIDHQAETIKLALTRDQFADLDSLKEAEPFIVLADPQYSHVTPASGEKISFQYATFMGITYEVTDYINRKAYEFKVQLINPQGIDEVYETGEWVNIYDIYGRKVTTTNEDIYTMELPRGIYIVVTEKGQTLKIMR